MLDGFVRDPVCRLSCHNIPFGFPCDRRSGPFLCHQAKIGEQSMRLIYWMGFFTAEGSVVLKEKKSSYLIWVRWRLSQTPIRARRFGLRDLAEHDDG
jgi:hypothetical protein